MCIRFAKIAALLATLLASLLLPGCNAVPEEQILALLFSPESLPSPTLTHKNFVIFVQGDADHFVTNTSDDRDAKLFRADVEEANRIKALAPRCTDCNVLLLHIQRGGKKWPSYLSVYAKGSPVLERKVPELNAASPALLTRFLQFAATRFPAEETHLIYRGHSFIPSYDPKTAGSIGIAPFDYSHPESPYGLDTFVKSIADAGLQAPLDSVTLASCSMSHLELAAPLAPYARTLIASQVDVLETLAVSFGFTFLDTAAASSSDTVEMIADTLLLPFVLTDHKTEAMMEFPLTRIRLDAIPAFNTRLQLWLLAVQTAQPDFFRSRKGKILAAAHVEKVLSDRYVNDLLNKGKDEAAINAMLKFVRLPANHPDALDLGQFLRFAATELPPALGAEARALEKSLATFVQVYRQPTFSNKSGLSFILDWNGWTGTAEVKPSERPSERKDP